MYVSSLSVPMKDRAWERVFHYPAGFAKLKIFKLGYVRFAVGDGDRFSAVFIAAGRVEEDTIYGGHCLQIGYSILISYVYMV